ncbi:MAG: hypothetical protein K0R38_3881 [Polyangiaceae bacterium]|nr:hypothetical protein [Polyangiaceae bacterium]
MLDEAARGPGSDAPGNWRSTVLAGLVVAALAWVPELLRPGYYFRDDMQTQYVPLFVELGRSWARGELPLVTDSTWAGGAIAGEYQHGAFSVVHAGLALVFHFLRLDAEVIAPALTASYAALAGAGAYRLALHYGVGRALALSVALIASLNGFNVFFSSWLPALTGFAWLPWTWWAAARTLHGERHASPLLAFFSYSLLCAGWHFAALMMALSLAYLVCFEPGPRPRRAVVLTLAPPLAVGALLSAPALLCFLEYVRASPRGDLAPPSWVWTMPLSALFGLLLPRTVSHWSPFDVPGAWSNVVMSGGALPLLLLPSAMLRASRGDRRRIAPLLGLAALVLLLAATPNLSAARWPFRWLPLFHLALALATARLLAPSTRAVTAPRRLASTPVALAAPALLLLLLWQPSERALLHNALLVAATACALSAVEKSPRWVPPVLAVGVAANLVFTPLMGPARDILPRWDTRACFRSANGRGSRHLALFEVPQFLAARRLASDRELSPGSCLFPGDSGLLSERPTASGYSLLFGSGVGQILESGVHGELGARQIGRACQGWAEPGSLLDRWGIAVLLVPSSWKVVAAPLLERGWRLEAAERDAHLFMRPAEEPPVVQLLESFYPHMVVRDVAQARQRLLESDGREAVYVPGDALHPPNLLATAPQASIAMLATSERRVSARVTVGPGSRPALIRLLRPWLPGQRATLDGATLRLGRADGAFVVAEVPAGSRGVLCFDYQPLGVRVPGIAAFALGFVGLLWLTLRSGRRAGSQRAQNPS